MSIYQKLAVAMVIITGLYVWSELSDSTTFAAQAISNHNAELGCITDTECEL